jgi:GH43 family beta-xylosidase
MKVKVMRNTLVFAITLYFLAAVSCGKGGSNPTPPPVDTTPTTTTTFTNPLLSSGPDPWVIQKDGYYYYTQTSGNKIALWKTQKIEDLQKVIPVTAWTPTINTAYSSDVWAPELHYIDNKWYIYFAADSSGVNSTHRMYILENTAADPTTGTWTFKGKIAPVTDTWAIDADVFTYNGISYIVWSGWQGNVDGEQDIFIAKLANPYTITGDRVLISMPTNDWEKKITGGINVIVNEGPEALKNAAGKLFLTFSAGGCWSDDYCIGLLTLRDGGDPMNAADWTKAPLPVFTKNTSGGVYGPGHNGFFLSPDSTQNWIIYHANSQPGQGCADARSPRAQPFTWNTDGTPNFGTPVAIGTKIQKPSGE